MGEINFAGLSKVEKLLMGLIEAEDPKPNDSRDFTDAMGSVKTFSPLFKYPQTKSEQLEKMAGSGDARYVWKTYQGLAKKAKNAADVELGKDYLASGAKFLCYPELYSFSDAAVSTKLDEMPGKLVAVNECLDQEKATDEKYLKVMTNVKNETVKKVIEERLKAAEKGDLADIDEFKKSEGMIRTMAEEVGIWDKYSAKFERAEKKVADRAQKAKEKEQVKYENEVKECLKNASEYAGKDQAGQMEVELAKASELLKKLNDQKDYSQQIEELRKGYYSKCNAKIDLLIAKNRFYDARKLAQNIGLENRYAMKIESAGRRLIEESFREVQKEIDSKKHVSKYGKGWSELSKTKRFAGELGIYAEYRQRFEEYDKYIK